MPIDINTFDFEAFFKRYNLNLNDVVVQNLIDALNNPEKALEFIKFLHFAKCPELEVVIKSDDSVQTRFNMEYYCHVRAKESNMRLHNMGVKIR